MPRPKRRKADSKTTSLKRRRTQRAARVLSQSPPCSRSSSVSICSEAKHRHPTAFNGTGRADSSSTIDKYIVQDDEVVENDDLCDLLGESEPDTEDGKTLPVRYLKSFDLYDYHTEERRVLPMSIDLDEDTVFFGASGLVRPQLLADDDEEDDTNSSTQADECVTVKLGVIQDVWTDKNDIWIQTPRAWYILEEPSESYRKYFEKVMKDAQTYEAPSSIRRSRMEPASTPFVTPRVGKITQGLFLRSLMMLNEPVVEDTELQNVCVPEVKFVTHDSTPSKMVWGAAFPGTKRYYKSVFVDGVEYHALDTVAVSAPRSSSEGEESDAPSSSSSSKGGTDKLSNSCWFAQICYFFERPVRYGNKRSELEKYFHLRWFSHGSQTILGETANPQALFLLDECDDNPVESILQKIRVRHLGVGDLEPVVISDSDVGSTSFHLSHKWDSEKMTMSTVDFDAEQSPASDASAAYAEQPAHMQCYACAIRQQKEVEQSCNKLNPDTLELYGRLYHANDFVYVRLRQKPPATLAVAQIVDLLPSSGTSYLRVSVFERIGRVPEEEQSPQMQRSLLHTGETEDISADCLDGHCFVSVASEIEDMDEWLEGPDNFILMHHKKPLKRCERCLTARKTQLECEKLFKKGRLLRALDLFAGAGGLTAGMDLSGYVKTCWAVERDSSAAQTLSTNHEDIVVYNQDCNLLLRHASDVQAGKNPHSIRSLGQEKEVLPPLPTPGEVDLIMGGPPCQPFSGMNRFKRVDDIRQTCIPTVLSYVEFYSPQYVLIENVTGLLHYRLNGRQEGRRIVDGVEAGMVKFIMRAFTSLGYQVQVRVLNSADYGAPQQRNRVIFWGARLDLALPKWPIPTHIPQKGHNNVTRRIADIGFAPIASRNEFEEGHRYAPFFSVTVKEAIDDLPSWDWENPGILYPKGVKGGRNEKETFPADTDQWRSDSEDAREVSGYNYPVLYASLPRTLYQATLRREQREQGEFSRYARVDDHYTALFSTRIVERTVNIPIRPLANFRDLPQPLRDARSVMGGGKKPVARNDTYWRLDGEGQFRTLMTLINPASKGAYVIHPTDKRVLTVRELARAQGFPDDYEFCSVNEGTNLQIKDMERQIGNAVPVPLAYALGRALGEGLAEIDRLKREQEDAVSVDEWDTRSAVSEEL